MLIVLLHTPLSLYMFQYIEESVEFCGFENNIILLISCHLVFLTSWLGHVLKGFFFPCSILISLVLLELGWALWWWWVSCSSLWWDLVSCFPFLIIIEFPTEKSGSLINVFFFFPNILSFEKSFLNALGIILETIFDNLNSKWDSESGWNCMNLVKM